MKKHYHRNGVSGQPFAVWLYNDFLKVQFSSSNKTISIPISEFESLVNHKIFKPKVKRKCKLRASKKFDNCTICAFDSDDVAFIGVFDPLCTDVGFAAFDWSLVQQGNVKFYDNSWRGDVLLEDIKKSIGKSEFEKQFEYSQ